jgi:hypothetical protein
MTPLLLNVFGPRLIVWSEHILPHLAFLSHLLYHLVLR